MATSQVLEDTGVRAYLGQAGNIAQRAVLGAAGTIVTVEARHAAAIAVLANNNAFGDKTDGSITPYGAFDRSSTMKKILNEVGDTGFIKGS